METANGAVLERRTFWQDHLEQWQHSGLTQVAYYRQHGLDFPRRAEASPRAGAAHCRRDPQAAGRD